MYERFLDGFCYLEKRIQLARVPNRKATQNILLESNSNVAIAYIHKPYMISLKVESEQKYPWIPWKGKTMYGIPWNWNVSFILLSTPSSTISKEHENSSRRKNDWKWNLNAKLFSYFSMNGTRESPRIFFSPLIEITVKELLLGLNSCLLPTVVV